MEDVVVEADAVVRGRWGFAADTDHSWVTGELLLRGDGVLLRRYGGDSRRGGVTSWRFSAWQVVSWWPGEADPDAAVQRLKQHAYDLYEPSPVPIDATEAGPVAGHPGPARPV